MGVTLSTGPAVVSGPMMAQYSGTQVPDANSLAGPGVTFQGDTIPDVRYAIQGAAEAIGAIRAHFDNSYLQSVNALPSAPSATNIAAAAATASGVPMTLVTTGSAGVAVAIPVQPFAALPPVTAICLDMGFTTLNCAAGNPVVTPLAGTTFFFTPGQQVIIGGVGNAGATLPLRTYVAAVGATTITLANAPAATNAAAPVSNMNVLNPLDVSQNGFQSTSWSPYFAAGVAAALNPLEGISRGVGITGNAGSTGGVFVVRGYDTYGQAMTQNLTHAGGATTIYSTKTFKFIASVTPQFTDAGHTYSVGTSNLFGFTTRQDYFEAANIYWNGTYTSTTTGWVAADVTNPATATTGDVRGTIQLTALGPSGSFVGTTSPNGAIRLSIYYSIPLQNMIQSTPANPTPMYGVTQF